MKPISLHGHERSITMIRFNREGDLLFSCAKDQYPNVWYSINGERLGTFGSQDRDTDSHGGAVWCLDVDWDTKHFLSGAADNTVRLWDVCTGKMLNRIDTKSAVRTCTFSYCGNYVAYSTDKQMGHQCIITLVDTRQFCAEKPVMTLPIPLKGPKVTATVFGSLATEDIGQLITGHDNGDIVQWDIRSKQKIKIVSDHGKAISDIQLSADRTMFISSSKDNTAKLFDVDTLECMKTYTTERPVNSACISPKYDHVVLGGGQEAMDVTTTSTRIGKFDARFFHLIFEEEFGRIKGHFGPINSVQFHPDGMGYASGGEDGYVRIHTFDQSYYEFGFEY
jgi:translation initiation factor 3 subunit I